MVYCRPYYSQESRKANEKFVMDCHYSICDTYGGCRGVTSKLNLSLHLTAFVFWNTYFFPGDHNTNRIPYIFKAYSRRIEFEQRRIFSLTDCKKGTSFPFFACRKKTRCTRSDFPICANWRLCILTKSNMKTLRKKLSIHCSSYFYYCCPLSSQYWLSQIALRDCFFFYDSDMYGNSYYSYVELSISKACSDTWKSWI